MADKDEQQAPGTAKPGQLVKAGCGFRYAEGELDEGVDFSAARDLLPEADRSSEEDRESTAPSLRPGKKRKK